LSLSCTFNPVVELIQLLAYLSFFTRRSWTYEMNNNPIIMTPRAKMFCQKSQSVSCTIPCSVRYSDPFTLTKADVVLIRNLSRTQNIYTGCANKKQSPRKNSVFQPWEYWFEPNFQTLYLSIKATYPANFIEITNMVQQIQHFKL